MSEPTPPSPAPPSAPPPPGQDSPSKRPPENNRQPDKTPDGQVPVEVRRAKNLYTVVAAFLVFIGVTSLMDISSASVAFRKSLNEADPSLSEQVSTGMINTLLVLTAVATLMVAVGHGLTSHALDERRSWSRPLGLTFSGILLGLAALNLLSGAQVMPSFFFAIAGLLGISLLGRPEVRDYLRPRWGGPGNGPNGGPPGGFPPGPGGYPPPPLDGSTPGAPPPGQHPHAGPQQPWTPPPGQGPPPNGEQPGQWPSGPPPAAPHPQGQPPHGQPERPTPNPQDVGDAGRQPEPGNRPSGENQQN